jgi:hypothetical protein
MSNPRRTRKSGAGTKPGSSEPRTLVRLTRKYADMIDGIDLRRAQVGDRLELPPQDAAVLLSEGWAEKVSTAADNPRPRKRPARK